MKKVVEAKKVTAKKVVAKLEAKEAPRKIAGKGGLR